MLKAIERAERVRRSIVPSKEIMADRLEVVARLREMANRVAELRVDDAGKHVAVKLANGNVSDARLCAQAAMKAADLDFPRWCE